MADTVYVQVTEIGPNTVTIAEPQNQVTISTTDPNSIFVATVGSSAGGAGGFTLHNEAGAPTASDGLDNDWYIDSSTNRLYGPKASGAWSGTYIELTATQREIFTQGSASTQWAITHALGGRPSVTVVDTSGTVVLGEVSYISDTQVQVDFTAAFAGYAYLT